MDTMNGLKEKTWGKAKFKKAEKGKAHKKNQKK